MKIRYIILVVSIALLSSFAAFDLLTGTHLSKEQMSNRILKEIENESPGGFLEIHLNEVQHFGLTVTKGEYNGIAAATYRAEMMDFKLQVMDAIKSDYFQKQWEAWLNGQGYIRADNLHDLALQVVNLAPYSPGTMDEMMDKINSTISSQADNIKDIDDQLKAGGLPSGAVANKQAERKKAVSQLNAAQAVKDKQSAGDDAFKNAFITWDHTADVLNDLDGVDNELNGVKIDMDSWKYGVGADHKKDVLASKQEYDAKRARIVQLLDKKKLGDDAFNTAYINYQKEALVTDKITTLTPADLQYRKDMRNPYLRLKKIMQVFMAQTDEIDFNAALTAKKQFSNSAYEEKSATWKFYYRRGEVFTNTAREVTKQWMNELK